MRNHILTVGDIVRLKEPYRPADFPQAKKPDWVGFGFGIVAEILTTQMIVNGEAYGNQHPRTVSLNLYDSAGQMMIEPTYVEAGLCIPPRESPAVALCQLPAPRSPTAAARPGTCPIRLKGLKALWEDSCSRYLQSSGRG